MKASELIKRLQLSVYLYGDMEVCVEKQTHGYCYEAVEARYSYSCERADKTRYYIIK